MEEITLEEMERRITGVDLDEVKAVVNRPDLNSYVSMMGRMGLSRFLIELEYKHFRPGTPLNQDFSLSIMAWPDDVPLRWVIVSVPKSYHEVVEEIAAKSKLSLEPPAYTFMVIGGGKEQQFPLSGPNIYMIEGAQGSAEYGTYDEKKKASEEEDAYCGVILEEHDKWLESPEGQEASWRLDSGDYAKRPPGGPNEHA